MPHQISLAKIKGKVIHFINGLHTVVLLVFLLASTVILSACSSSKNPPPNFVFILVDDLGWTDLGCYGSTFHETPHLDALARQGIRFTNAYASSPVCSPTRAAIMTGKYPTRVNITDWIPGNDPKDQKLLGPQDLDHLPLKEVTLAEAFQQQGYQTFFAGKWHLGDEGFFPEQQGFSINKGGHHVGSPPGGYYVPYDNPKLTDGPEGEYLTDRLTDESIQFIEASQDQPFLLYLSYYTVHTPIQACERHIEKFETKATTLPGGGEPEYVQEHEGYTLVKQVRPDYASMVHAMDENIGRLLQKLEESGKADNTIVIFTSDNGGLSTLPENRIPPTSVKPLRGGKGWCYEGGIRVPLIIKAPGITTAGSTSDVPVISHDFYPTLLALAGFSAMPEQHQDGVNLLPLLEGKQALDREALFWHFPHYHGSTWTPGAAIRMGEWKLIEFYDYAKTELYNLSNDEGEHTDLSEAHPEKVKALKAKLLELQQTTKAKFPTPNETAQTHN